MPADQDLFDAREPGDAGDGAHVPAARQGSDEPAQPARPGPELRDHHHPAAAAAAAADPLSLDGGSGLVESLMAGMPDGERTRLLGMIASSVEAERAAAMEGTVRRQVDVGTRRRSSRREVDLAVAAQTGADLGDPGSDEAGAGRGAGGDEAGGGTVAPTLDG